MSKIAPVLIPVIIDQTDVDAKVSSINRKLSGIGGRGFGGGGGYGGFGGGGEFGSGGAMAGAALLGASQAGQRSVIGENRGEVAAEFDKYQQRLKQELDSEKYDTVVRRLKRGTNNPLSRALLDKGDRDHKSGLHTEAFLDPYSRAAFGIGGAVEDLAQMRSFAPGLVGPAAVIGSGILATNYMKDFNKNRASNFSDLSKFKGADFGLAQGIKSRAQERLSQSQSAMDSFWLGAEEATGGEGSWMERALAQAPITGSNRARGIGAAVATGDGIGKVLLDAFLGTTHLDYIFGSPYASETTNVAMKRAGA